MAFLLEDALGCAVGIEKTREMLAMNVPGCDEVASRLHRGCGRRLRRGDPQPSLACPLLANQIPGSSSVGETRAT